jgi:hypothetical protein
MKHLGSLRISNVFTILEHVVELVNMRNMSVVIKTWLRDIPWNM